MDAFVGLLNVVVGALIASGAGFGAALLNHRLQDKKERRSLKLKKMEEISHRYTKFYMGTLKILTAFFNLGNGVINTSDYEEIKNEHLQSQSSYAKLLTAIRIYCPELRQLLLDVTDRKTRGFRMEKMYFARDAYGSDIEEILKEFDKNLQKFREIGEKLHEKISDKTQEYI